MNMSTVLRKADSSQPVGSNGKNWLKANRSGNTPHPIEPEASTVTQPVLRLALAGNPN